MHAWETLILKTFLQFQIVSNSARMHALETLFSFFSAFLNHFNYRQNACFRDIIFPFSLFSKNIQHDWTKTMLLKLGITAHFFWGRTPASLTGLQLSDCLATTMLFIYKDMCLCFRTVRTVVVMLVHVNWHQELSVQLVDAVTLKLAR